MTELPLECPDCGRRHWSVAAMMTCRCEAEYLEDANGGMAWFNTQSNASP